MQLRSAAVGMTTVAAEAAVAVAVAEVAEAVAVAGPLLGTWW